MRSAHAEREEAYANGEGGEEETTEEYANVGVPVVAVEEVEEECEGGEG